MNSVMATNTTPMTSIGSVKFGSMNMYVGASRRVRISSISPPQPSHLHFSLPVQMYAVLLAPGQLALRKHQLKFADMKGFTRTSTPDDCSSATTSDINDILCGISALA
jgi:hypothetical protein